MPNIKVCVVFGPYEPLGDGTLDKLKHGLALRILGDMVKVSKKGQGQGKKPIKIWDARITLEFWNTHKVALEAAGYWIQWPQVGEEGRGKDGFSKHLANIAKNLD